MSDHFKGLLFTLLGVLVLSPDTLLIRLADMDQWAMLVYRGLMMAAGMALITRALDTAPLSRQYLKIGRTGLVAACCFATSTIAFVNAVVYTTVAHTLIIVATAPMFAALFGRIVLGERLRPPTFVAIVCVMLGMVLVAGQPDEGAHWLGNLCALISAVSIAVTFVLNRKNRDTNMIPAISISGVLYAVIAAPFASWEALDGFTLSMVAMMGVVVTLAFVLITVAPRYIPAAEVSLVLPLETVGGIALAWWILGEKPGVPTLAGAMIILLTLMVHSWLVLRVVRR